MTSVSRDPSEIVVGVELWSCASGTDSFSPWTRPKARAAEAANNCILSFHLGVSSFGGALIQFKCLNWRVLISLALPSRASSILDSSRRAEVDQSIAFGNSSAGLKRDDKAVSVVASERRRSLILHIRADQTHFKTRRLSILVSKINELLLCMQNEFCRVYRAAFIGDS